jgi:hypothetical protein
VPGAAAAHGGSSSHGGGAAPAGHGDAGHGAASAGQDTVKTKAAVDWGVVQSVNVTGQPTAGAKHGADAELGVDFHQGVSELGSVLGHELHPANDQLTAKGPKLESGAAAQVAALNQLPPKRLPRPHGEADAPAMAHNRLISALGELHAATAAAKTAHDGPSKQAALENSISAYLKVKSATDLVHIVTRDEQKIINDPNTPVGLDGSPALVFATKGDPLLKAAAWLKPVSGQIDVVVHGTSNNFKVRKGGKMVDLDIDHIAEVIKAHTGGDQDIRLISCSTGSHDTSVAQVLADKLGVKVTAPSDTVWLTHDGRTVIGKNAFEATGTWNSYAPKKPPQTGVAPSDLPKPGDKLAGNVAAGDDTLKPDISDPVALADVKPVTVDLGQSSSQPAPVRRGYQQFNPRGAGADGNVYDHAPGTQFEGQDKVGTSFLNDGAPRISNAAAPPLRISPNGKLAIEDTDLTTRQPKHFFAAPDAVPGWNKSLEAAGSRYRIVTVDAQTVSFTLPAGGGQQTLVKAQAQNITTKALGNDLTTAMNCDDVVQKVTGSSGEPKPQTANPLASPPPAGPTQDLFYGSYVAADLAAAAGRGGPTGGMPHGGFNVSNPAAGVNDVANNYGDAMHGHLNGAPNAALDTRMQDLGVNQYANPKVGQGFVTFSQGMRVPIPGSPNQQQVHDPYNGRTLAPANSDNSWGQHWGGVVAHDDGAHVTLENYARNAEDKVAATDDSRFYFQMYGSGPGQSWHDAWSRLNTGSVPGVREFANPLTMVAAPKDSVQAFNDRAQRNYGDQYKDIKNEYASVGAATNVEDLTIASLKGLSYANKHLNSEGSSPDRADAGRLDAWRNNVGAARDAAIPGSWSESARPLLDHVGSSLDKVKKGPISAAKEWLKKQVGITGDKVTAPPTVDGAKPPDAVAAGSDVSEPVNKAGDTVGGIDDDGEHPAAVAASGDEHEYLDDSDDSDDEGLWQRPPERQPAPAPAPDGASTSTHAGPSEATPAVVREDVVAKAAHELTPLLAQDPEGFVTQYKKVAADLTPPEITALRDSIRIGGRAAPEMTAGMNHEQLIEFHQKRLAALRQIGDFGQMTYHGTGSSMLDGLAKTDGQIVPAAELQQHDVERTTGEGTRFLSDLSERGHVSVGDGESGFGTAMAYADATNSMAHHNPRLLSDVDLQANIDRLQLIVANHDSIKNDLSPAFAGVYTRGKDRFSAELQKLQQEAATRVDLPADSPVRTGGQTTADNHPILFEFDMSNATTAQTPKPKKPGLALSGEVSVHGAIDLKTTISRAYVPAEHVHDVEQKLAQVLGHQDFEVVPTEAVHNLPAPGAFESSRAATYKHIAGLEDLAASIDRAYETAARDGRPLTDDLVHGDDGQEASLGADHEDTGGQLDDTSSQHVGEVDTDLADPNADGAPGAARTGAPLGDSASHPFDDTQDHGGGTPAKGKAKQPPQDDSPSSPRPGAASSTALVTNSKRTGLHKSDRKAKGADQPVTVRSGGLFGTGTKLKIPSGSEITTDPTKPVSGDAYVYAEYSGRQGYVKTSSLGPVKGEPAPGPATADSGHSDGDSAPGAAPGRTELTSPAAGDTSHVGDLAKPPDAVAAGPDVSEPVNTVGDTVGGLDAGTSEHVGATDAAWKPSAAPSDLVRPGDEFTRHPGSTHDTAVAAAHDSAKDPEVLLDLLPLDVFMKMNFNVPPGTTGQLGPVSFSADASVGMMAVSGNPPTIRFNPAVVSQMDPQAVYFIAQHEIAHIAHGHPDNSHVESAPNEMQADYTALVSAVTNNMAGGGWSAARNFTKLLEQLIARGNAGGGGSHPVLTFRKERLEVLAQLIHDEATVRVEIHSPAFWPNSQMEQALGVLRVESKDLHRNPDGSSFIDGDGETGYGDYLKWCEDCSALPTDVRDLLTVTSTWIKGPMDVYQAHADDLRFNDKFGFVDQKVGELTI